MRLLQLLSVSVLALGLGSFQAEAQSFRGSNGPAEQPPASFKGKQYVDSRGCVFIRAGYGGRVTWVPRVTRDRKQVCGARSSVAPRAQTAKAAPKAAPKPTATKVVRGKPPKGAKVISREVKVIPAAPKPKTTTRVVRKAAPAPKTQTRVVRRQVQTAPAATAQVRTVQRCSGASSFSQQFVNQGARCGPQGTPSRSIVREEVSPQSRNTVGREQLKGPQGVNRRIKQAAIKPPKGYKAAFDDGRLNPLRGVGTSSGKAQMGLVWSNTVPRYLIDPATGKRATAARKRVLGIF
ncbi:hypothetical protein C8N43_3271 [Litoreibacter ponti]|uniref:Uncharacterized protein n=1 Tax=Litoreibacter ponti TaxID=1510457 RepID=A0A2T6BEH3_9RHOB|nr:hypothetical protein [Litoreibacter ponti]PTX54456.1 hypothetical protein C8N43_3271 [Litoreibacter ponti]